MATVLVQRKIWSWGGALSGETATSVIWLTDNLNCFLTTEAVASHCLQNSPGLPLHLWLSSGALILPSVKLLYQLYHESQFASTQQNIRMTEYTKREHNSLSWPLTATRFLKKEAGHKFCVGILYRCFTPVFIWLLINPELPKFICLMVLSVGRFELNTAL